MPTNKPIHIQEKNCEFLPSDENFTWEVIYVKPKREKKLAKFALERGIKYFLPLKDSERKYKYRTVKFTKPLISGYLFTKCNYNQKQELIRTGFILSFLKVKNEEELLMDLENLYKSREINVPLREVDYLEKGSKVLIKTGSFKGLHGYVEKDKNNTLILQLRLLKKSFTVEIDFNKIEVLYEEE